jgi:hypothetical protein
MLPQAIRRPFPAPSLAVFFSLQVLDVLTTLIGLSMGAQEASVFVGRLLHLGPIAGLLIPKLFSLLLLAAAIRFNRARLIVFMNYWFAAVVTWNLITIFGCLRRW